METVCLKRESWLDEQGCVSCEPSPAHCFARAPSSQTRRQSVASCFNSCSSGSRRRRQARRTFPPCAPSPSARSRALSPLPADLQCARTPASGTYYHIFVVDLVFLTAHVAVRSSVAGRGQPRRGPDVAPQLSPRSSRVMVNSRAKSAFKAFFIGLCGSDGHACGHGRWRCLVHPACLRPHHRDTQHVVLCRSVEIYYRHGGCQVN